MDKDRSKKKGDTLGNQIKRSAAEVFEKYKPKNQGPSGRVEQAGPSTSFVTDPSARKQPSSCTANKEELPDLSARKQPSSSTANKEDLPGPSGRVEQAGTSASFETDLSARTQPSCSTATEEELPDSRCLEECQKQLRSIYETNSKVKIVPWDQSSAVHIDEIYTQLSWLMDEKKPSGVTQKELKHYTDIFDGERLDHLSKRILVHGRPGIGKTVFTQKATFDWSQHRFEGKLGRFDLVLLVKLRDVCNLNDVPAILSAADLLASDGPISTDNLYDYVRHHQEKVLLILDGYDEYVHSEASQSPVLQIWEKKQLRDCCVIITSRDMKGEELKSSSDAQFEIDGFDRKRQEEFARRFLKDDQDVKEFFKYLKQQDLEDVAKIPLLLVMLLLVWKEKDCGGLPSSRPAIYFQFIETLFDHMSEKQKKPAEKVDDHKEELCKVGELAFDALLQDLLYFPLSKLPDHVLTEKLIEAGLFQLLKMSALNPCKDVHFIHKSMQEFLASLFLKGELFSQNNSLFKVDSIEKIFKLTEVFKFAAEMSEEAAREILIYLLEMAAKEDGEYSFDNQAPSIEDLSDEQKNLLILCTQLFFYCSADTRTELFPTFLSNLGGVFLINPDQLNIAAKENFVKITASLMYIFFSASDQYTEQSYNNLITLAQQLNAVIVSRTGEQKASEFLNVFPWRRVNEFFLMKDENNTHLYFTQIVRRYPFIPFPFKMVMPLVSLEETTKKTNMNGDESSEESSSSSCCSKRHGLSRVRRIKGWFVNRSEVELMIEIMPLIIAPHWIDVWGEDSEVFDAEVTESLLRSIPTTHKLERLTLCDINITSSPAVEFISRVFKQDLPNLKELDMSRNPLLGAGVDSLIKHLSCAPHLEELLLWEVKMTPQQVMNLTSAVQQHGNITKLLSHYHVFKTLNPKPEHEWPSENYWKRKYSHLFPNLSPESAHEQEENEGEVIESEDGKASYESEENQEQAVGPDQGGKDAMPSEILARGRIATEAYRRALLEGKGYARRVPVMIIGQARTGKTSLKRSLKGELFNPDEGSTEGIETDPSYFKVTTDVWRTGQKSEDTESEPTFLLDHQVAQKIVESLRKGDRSGDPSTSGAKPSINDSKVVEQIEANSLPTDRSEEISSSGVEPSLQDSKVVEKAKPYSNKPNPMRTDLRSSRTELSLHASNVPEKAQTSSSRTEQSGSVPSLQDSKDHLSVPELPENVAALVQNLLERSQEFEDEENIYSIIWDFGGQSVYYATHPIFLTKQAIYILACDLSRDPDQKGKAPTKKGMYENKLDTHCKKTNRDYLDFWMTSVYSLVSPSTNRQETLSPEVLPAVFLACTHADKPYKKRANPKELAEKIFATLKEKIYGDLLKEVFVVDNTKSGSNDECQDVKNLRETVLSVAKELPRIKKAIPLKWLKYEKVLRLLSEEGYMWIPIERARQIASDECGIDDDEQFRTLLNFLHDQRILIHFSETANLEKMVILSPQWLIDIFKEVITVKRFKQTDKTVARLWRNFEKTGILDETLLNHAWRPLSDNRETCETLIAIMKKFSLLCAWPSDGTTQKYLVPSMLMSPPTDDVRKHLDCVRTPSLFVAFESGRVPPGLFSRFVLQFHRLCQEEWKSEINPDLFNNFAMFHILPDRAISLVFMLHSSSIEIVFHDGKDARDLNTSRFIYSQLKCVLEHICMEFFWLKHVKYKMCVCCPVCSQEDRVTCRTHVNRGCDCLHLLSESELRERPYCNRPVICGDRTITITMFEHWFAFCDSQQSRIPLTKQQSAIEGDNSGKRGFYCRQENVSETTATDPPQVVARQITNKDLPPKSKHFDYCQIQVDILLLTVVKDDTSEDCEFLSCLQHVNPDLCKIYHPDLGYVYLGDMGEDDLKLNVAVMKCYEGSSSAGGSIVVVINAVKVLKPKAVFCVGSCSGLNDTKVSLGDVVVLKKLVTYAFSKVTENGIEELGVKVPLKPHLSKLILGADDGWTPPLKDPGALEVKIHRGTFLSGPEVINNHERCNALIERFPEAVAIEREGEGVFVAAHDLDIEWVVIKGISGYADGRKVKDSWRTFASFMAASLAAHILSDTNAFQALPHYGSARQKRKPQTRICKIV